ncbi:PDZ domain-containing protein [Streptomyces sp. NPDC007084]|uniref:PDZ domain-containing protein n=1 Tax=Streptomyces sp. NPDC007084 TaxID=3154313 RepID=UPI003452F466
MEQTALRPKPMPGQEPGTGERPVGAVRRPHAARRRGRRLVTLVFSLFVGVVLVLSGVGLGTVGATVIGMSKLAAMQKQAAAAGEAHGPSGGPGRAGASAAPRPGGTTTATASGSAAPVPPGKAPDGPARATLGIEAVDAPDGAGALLVGVHQPGPGYTAGLVRGDILFSVAGTTIKSASDLAHAITTARPGEGIPLGVRHTNGTRAHLSAIPGIVT